MTWNLADRMADPRMPIAALTTDSEAASQSLPRGSRERLAALIRGIERFDLSRPVMWYQTDETISSDYHAFLPLRMPYPRLWAEATVEVPVEHRKDNLGDRFYTAGILIHESPYEVGQHIEGATIAPDPALTKGAEYVLMIQPFRLLPANLIGSLVGGVLLFVTAAGNFVRWMSLGAAADKDVFEQIDQAMIRPLLFGLALSNVKGARVSEPVPRGSASRKQRRERREYLKYRIISIPGTPTAPSRGGGLSGVAMHLVRGNFATYTDEAPLFGRQTGTFWRPAHVRGNPEYGVIDKDYEVKP